MQQIEMTKEKHFLQKRTNVKSWEVKFTAKNS